MTLNDLEWPIQLKVRMSHGLLADSVDTSLASVVNRLVAQLWKTSSLALPCPADDAQTGLVVCHDAQVLSELLHFQSYYRYVLRLIDHNFV